MEASAEQDEAWNRAETLLDPPCRTAVVRLLQPWARAHLATKDDDEVPQAAVLPPTLTSELRTALSEPTTTAPYSDWQLAAWSVRVEAVVTEFLAMPPNPAAAETLLRFHAPPPAWRALQQRLRLADNAGHAAWVAFLALPPTDLVAALAEEANVSFERLIEDWTETRPFSLFDASNNRSRPSWAPVATWERTRMVLLLRIRPTVTIWLGWRADATTARR